MLHHVRWEVRDLFDVVRLRFVTLCKAVNTNHDTGGGWQQFHGKGETSLTDTLGGQKIVRSAGRARLFVQGGVFILNYTEKMYGTDQNRPFERGVRLSRVFARQGSTVLII